MYFNRLIKLKLALELVYLESETRIPLVYQKMQKGNRLKVLFH